MESKLLFCLFILLIVLGYDLEESTPKNESQKPIDEVIEQSPQKNAEKRDDTSGEPVFQGNDYYTGIPRGMVLDATIVRVVDGDTLKIYVNGKEDTIRLLLVDTPETVHPAKLVEPLGPEASQFAKETLPPGKTVEIELDINERDKYGRLLCYLYVDGKMFNELLLEKGLARVAHVYTPNTRYAGPFYQVQKQAQAKKIGIWSIDKNNQGHDVETAEDLNPESSLSGEYTIKGNISSRGEKIYHMPGQRHYDATKPEEMFRSEEEAQRAGYRKSKR